MAMIDREEAIRIIASYPGPVDKSVVRRILTQMDDEQDESEYWHEKASSYEQTIVRLCEGRTWIPVTERLPEDDREVLITYADNDDGSPSGVDITTYGTFTFGSQPVKDYSGRPILKWRPPFQYFAGNYHVTAWMELPMPYEGGEQDG